MNAPDIPKQSATSRLMREPHSLRPSAGELLAESSGILPVWIRAPRAGGAEYYTGLTRAKLYQLATAGLITTRSLREPGRVKGVRLFLLASILAYVEKCDGESRKLEGGVM